MVAEGRVGLEPADGLIDGQGVFIALAEDDGPEVADLALEVAEAGVAVLHQLVVDAHRGTEFAFFLEALALEHPGVEAAELGPIALVKVLELSEGLVEQFVARLGAKLEGLGLLVIDDGVLKLVLHQGGVGTVASLAAGVALGDELGEGLVNLLDRGLGPGVCLAGLAEGGAGLGELGVRIALLLLALKFLGLEHRCVPALDVEPGQLDQGFGGEGVVGEVFGELVELGAGLLQEDEPFFQVGRAGRLVEQAAADLVVEHRLEVGGGVGGFQELLGVFQARGRSNRVRGARGGSESRGSTPAPESRRPGRSPGSSGRRTFRPGPGPEPRQSLDVA